MAEQVDARDSKSRAARRSGSIPDPGTNSYKSWQSQHIRTRPFSYDGGFFYASGWLSRYQKVSKLWRLIWRYIGLH
jgi:hypothetical protein